jgi:hypothetical protein
VIINVTPSVALEAGRTYAVFLLDLNTPLSSMLAPGLPVYTDAFADRHWGTRCLSDCASLPKAVQGSWTFRVLGDPPELHYTEVCAARDLHSAGPTRARRGCLTTAPPF